MPNPRGNRACCCAPEYGGMAACPTVGVGNLHGNSRRAVAQAKAGVDGGVIEPEQPTGNAQRTRTVRQNPDPQAVMLVSIVRAFRLWRRAYGRPGYAEPCRLAFAGSQKRQQPGSVPLPRPPSRPIPKSPSPSRPQSVPPSHPVPPIQSRPGARRVFSGG